MHPRVPALTVLMLMAAPLLGGCQSNSYSCSGGICHVTVNGAGQTLELDDTEVTVTEISGDRMTVRVDGSSPITIGAGQSRQVGSATVKVTSINGDEAKFDVE